jgi:hypothetical protein
VREIGDVHDHRMILRPSLDREDAPHRTDVGGVGAEPVDRFGRERDESPLAQQCGCARDRRGIGGDDRHALSFGEATCSDVARRRAKRLPLLECPTEKRNEAERQ